MHLDPLLYRGVIPMVTTPFHDDETLDLESLERLVRFSVAAGVDGVTVLGLLGESNRLTDTERARVIETAVTAAGTLPVIVSATHGGTSATIALAHQAVQLGAAAVMIAPPPAPSASGDQGTVDYFERIATGVSAPIIVQDSSISGGDMSVELLLQLLEAIPHIVSIKAEAVPTAQKIAALKASMTEHRATILTGLGALYAVFDLERGSDGFIAGFTFPEVLIAVTHEFRANGADAARQIYARYLPLIVFEQQPGTAIRKETLRRRRLIESNRVRHPGSTIDAETTEQLHRLLDATFPGEDITVPVNVGALRPFLVNI